MAADPIYKYVSLLSKDYKYISNYIYILSKGTWVPVCDLHKAMRALVHLTEKGPRIKESFRCAVYLALFWLGKNFASVPPSFWRVGAHAKHPCNRNEYLHCYKRPGKISRAFPPLTRGLINRKENSLSYTHKFCFRFASRV
jgi:hypothetical protein